MGACEVVAHGRALHVRYRAATGAADALVDVSIDVPRSALTVVAGPSGSGKSSLLLVLAGLLRPRSGTVEVDGHELTRLRPAEVRRVRRRRMGVVLQVPADNLVHHLTALEQVELAARLRGADARLAHGLLASLELDSRAGAYPGDLSGGEQQRVAFAAAAVGEPAVLLADEPTAQLDAHAGGSLVTTMRVLVHQGASLVVASHDDAVIAAADHLVTLEHGRVLQS